MASRLIGGRLSGLIYSRRITYLPNFSAIVQHFSKNCASQQATVAVQPLISEYGSSCFEVGKARVLLQNEDLLLRGENSEELLDNYTVNIFQQVSQWADDIKTNSIPHKPASLYSAECIIHECAPKLKTEFQELFPARDLQKHNFTAITISQRTKNDMSVWNSDVEAEREELLHLFNNGAKEICTSLEALGYWADFVDPSSGVPFFGEHTNSSLFETDYRFTRFGFTLTDLGCCKVISHSLWGNHAYVGIIFTDAPADHPLLLPLDQ